MTDLATIADAVDALTNPMHVREPYRVWHGNNPKVLHHIHVMPSLVRQLEAAKHPGQVYLEDDGGHLRRTPGSVAPARIDAINLEFGINVGAANWVWRTHQPVREDTSANLRALVGARTDSDMATQILSQVRRWVNQALVIAGWQRPPWRPKASCPVCDRFGTLRVRLDLKIATCVECGEGWNEATIGLLGQHVATTTAGRVLAN